MGQNKSHNIILMPLKNYQSHIFVKWSAILTFVMICSSVRRLCLFHWLRSLYFMSIYQIWGVCFWVTAIVVQASLSSQRNDAAPCDLCRSQSVLQTNSMSLGHTHDFSLSGQVSNDWLRFHFVCYSAPSKSCTHASKLTYPWRICALWWGHPSVKRRS